MQCHGSSCRTHSALSLVDANICPALALGLALETPQEPAVPERPQLWMQPSRFLVVSIAQACTRQGEHYSDLVCGRSARHLGSVHRYTRPWMAVRVAAPAPAPYASLCQAMLKADLWETHLP